ncbi:hypothetical protein EVAR_67140_1 [Eumeta japonica]|uniref:Uncharacterized protein n=1 Tax=Eumeta variegata TaxID=151549 RepID=A0A4C1ZXH0_EUMVA|nr:hypothetical protein EVAR_67140_1 [Eumeta japonica]
MSLNLSLSAGSSRSFVELSLPGPSSAKVPPTECDRRGRGAGPQARKKFKISFPSRTADHNSSQDPLSISGTRVLPRRPVDVRYCVALASRKRLGSPRRTWPHVRRVLDGAAAERGPSAVSTSWINRLTYWPTPGSDLRKLIGQFLRVWDRKLLALIRRAIRVRFMSTKMFILHSSAPTVRRARRSFVRAQTRTRPIFLMGRHKDNFVRAGGRQSSRAGSPGLLSESARFRDKLTFEPN